MKWERRGIRLKPKEFEEYKVRIDLGELTLEGSLGNISDSGLCVILPEDALLDEVGSEVTGAIHSKIRTEYLDFQGRIAWSNLSEDEKGYLSGIEFSQTIVLSNHLITKSMLDD